MNQIINKFGQNGRCFSCDYKIWFNGQHIRDVLTNSQNMKTWRKRAQRKTDWNVE